MCKTLRALTGTAHVNWRNLLAHAPVKWRTVCAYGTVMC